jgi:hypothetical protein
MLKNYRKKCKKEQRNYKIKILNMMDRLQTTNPKGYWKLVEELTDKHKTKTDIEVEKLHKHYHHLNSTININNMVEKEHMNVQLRETEKIKSFSDLDFTITESEVRMAIKTLKNGKSSGYDMIKNEMVKYGHNVLTKPLAKLFNLVMNSQYYPQ